MTSTLPFDLETALERVSSGECLTRDEITHLAETPDILAAGMLADAVRRRVAGRQVSYVRVALVDAGGPLEDLRLPDVAREIRLTGSPSFDVALQAIASVRTLAGDRVVSGFSWLDVGTWTAAGGTEADVLAKLRAVGLDALAEVPLDRVADAGSTLAVLTAAGFTTIRLTMANAAPSDQRVDLFLRAAPHLTKCPSVVAIAPLPMVVNALRPTTGYDDVKAVALARLAMPDIGHIQVDWLRYGPKLAQVALTFGADDVDNVSPSDAQPDGPRRAPIEELRRNIESAGFAPVERDGRFLPIAR